MLLFQCRCSGQWSWVGWVRDFGKEVDQSVTTAQEAQGLRTELREKESTPKKAGAAITTTKLQEGTSKTRSKKGQGVEEMISHNVPTRSLSLTLRLSACLFLISPRLSVNLPVS